MAEDYDNMTVAELKVQLKEAGLPVSGKKADLIARLSDVGDAPVEETVVEEAVVEEAVVEEAVVEEAVVETDNLNQRIAELDYLREYCGNYWIQLNSEARVRRRSCARINFKNVMNNKSVYADSNVNYEDVLVQLEKLPELLELWLGKKINSDSFNSIESYKLEKPLFKDGQNNTEKIKVLEQLVNKVTNYDNRQ